MMLFTVGLSVFGEDTYFAIVADKADNAIEAAKKVALTRSKRKRGGKGVIELIYVSQDSGVIDGLAADEEKEPS
jgi:hypothetical protein